MECCVKNFAHGAALCMRIGYVNPPLAHLVFTMICIVFGGSDSPPFLIYKIKMLNRGTIRSTGCISLGLYGGRGPTSQIGILKIRGTIFRVVRTFAGRVPSHMFTQGRQEDWIRIQTTPQTPMTPPRGDCFFVVCWLHMCCSCPRMLFKPFSHDT